MNKPILSEKEYGILFENAVDPILILDKKGRFIEINKKVEEILGYKKEDLIGKKFIESNILSEKSKMIAYKNFIKRMLGFNIKPYEIEVIKKNGGIIIGEINASPVKDGKKIIGDMVIVRDITERKKTEEEIKNAQEKWDSLTQNTNDIIMIVDDKNIIQYINKTIPPYVPEETVGKSVYEYVPREQQDIMRNSLRKVFRTGKPGSYEISSNIPKIGIVWFTTKVVPIKHDGRIDNVITISTDITESKEAEEALKESEKKYKVIVENASDWIFLLDTELRYISLNKAVANILHSTVSELIGKSVLGMFPKDIAARFARNNYEVIKTGKSKFTEEKMIINGRAFYISTSLNPIKNSKGKVTAVMGIIRDITERKKVEEELKKARNNLQKSYKELKVLDELKDNFVNITAHELKTPLVPIISYIEFMLKDKKSKMSKKEKNQLEICLRNAIRLKDMVTEVSDISKLETKIMKFNMKSVKIESIINNTLDTFKPAIKNKNLDLIVNIKPNLPLINGDPERLIQALSKLIENSIKFTDKGKITISVEKQRNNIIVKVGDTGIGIVKENIPKLFTKFFQTDETPTRNTQGTGLGLSICKEIIKAHKGKVWVESKGLGKGSTFIFKIPTKSQD